MPVHIHFQKMKIILYQQMKATRNEDEEVETAKRALTEDTTMASQYIEVCSHTYHGVERLLGIFSDILCDTSMSGTKLVKVIEMCIRELCLYTLPRIAIKPVINMLIVSMHSFSPLLLNFNLKQLLDIDHYIANETRPKFGLTHLDASGLSICSMLIEYLVADCHELEVHLNSKELHGVCV